MERGIAYLELVRAVNNYLIASNINEKNSTGRFFHSFSGVLKKLNENSLNELIC